MQKIAYLTIDDAPSSDFRRKVDYLSAKSIPAVFFCIGKLLERRQVDAVYSVRRGFILGNHSYSHIPFSDMCLYDCYKDIARADALIDRIYKRAKKPRPAKFFRFPFGDKGGLKHTEVFERYTAAGERRKEKLQQFLKSLGYRQPKFPRITYKYYKKAGLLDDVDWHWTYDVMEYAIFEKEHPFGIDTIKKVFDRMDENVPEGCRGLNYRGSDEIILVHDHANSAKLFMPIIERLLSKGLSFRLPISFSR